MKLRLAKKILSKEGRKTPYTEQQRRRSAYRLIHWVRLVVDSKLDIKREKMDGNMMRERAGVETREYRTIETVPGPPKPVYRKDGQVHNFNALPYPGKFKPHVLTQARYDARYQNARPTPKRYYP